MATFVLLHGGGMGGWCWKFVREILEAKGHRVLTPTFTGFGEREHLIGRGIGNAVHVQDIVNVLKYEEVTDAVLVGHSYSGTVIPGILAEAGERVEHIVYVDAIVPLSGERIAVLLGMGAEKEIVELDLMLDEDAGPLGSGVHEFVRAMSKEHPAMMDPSREKWMLGLLSDQPMRATSGVIPIGAETINRPVHYIAAEHSMMGAMHERARNLGWTIHSHPADHSLHVGHPDETTAIILNAAGLS